jgi:hypothetical protein
MERNISFLQDDNSASQIWKCWLRFSISNQLLTLMGKLQIKVKDWREVISLRLISREEM